MASDSRITCLDVRLRIREAIIAMFVVIVGALRFPRRSLSFFCFLFSLPILFGGERPKISNQVPSDSRKIICTPGRCGRVTMQSGPSKWCGHNVLFCFQIPMIVSYVSSPTILVGFFLKYIPYFFIFRFIPSNIYHTFFIMIKIK